MKIIISPPPSTTVAATFHRPFSYTATFPSRTPPLRRDFCFLTGGVTFADTRSKATHKSTNKDVLSQSDLPFANEQHAIALDDQDIGHRTSITKSQEISLPNDDIKEFVKDIKSILGSMEDGVITPSAYDTAWVALIEGVNGRDGGPQFPSSLEWVVNHQLPDGSWGEPVMFSAYDRLINTLTCVIALTFWNIHLDKREKGIEFVNRNMYKLEDEKEENMTLGFKMVFPMLIELALKLEIRVHDDTPALKEIYARRDTKLVKIPKDIFHKAPTTLLYSLEGMKDLEWEKLLKLRCKNGSFLFSPSATAFAFMQTKDQHCLAYLTNLVAKFSGGVPTFYPADTFEHIWTVDRLQRLGIARYFHPEIKNCVDYIYRCWDEQGMGFGRNCNVPDIDTTAMAFRVLRTNGYQLSPDVFRHFEKDGQFFCYPGQLTESVTVMFNLYRASQVLFPGEKILNDAKNFSHKFLTEKRSTNELLDKWIIIKDLCGEVKYALDVPWYASLPRLEARYYLEQYGGEDDVWIGKSLYRMKVINNNKYLEMAKLDYNHCQAIHQLEWGKIQKWYDNINIEDSLSPRLLRSYYGAAASIFEPERSNERVAWAKTTILLDMITSYFAKPRFSNDDMIAFIDEFINPKSDHINGKPWHMIMIALHETLGQISSETFVAHGVDIKPYLHNAWTTWLLNLQKGVNVIGSAELIVRTITMTSGRWFSEEILSHPQYQRISSVTNDVCHQLFYQEDHAISLEVESKMQQLVQLVLTDSQDDLDANFKHTFLIVAKTFYYNAYFNHDTIKCHVDKVLFDRVI